MVVFIQKGGIKMGIFGPPNIEKLKTEKNVQSLIKVLRYKDKHIRLKALQVLGEIGDNRAIEPLTNVLKDKDSEFRETAAEALKRIKDRMSSVMKLDLAVDYLNQLFNKLKNMVQVNFKIIDRKEIVYNLYTQQSSFINRWLYTEQFKSTVEQKAFSMGMQAVFPSVANVKDEIEILFREFSPESPSQKIFCNLFIEFLILIQNTKYQDDRLEDEDYRERIQEIGIELCEMPKPVLGKETTHIMNLFHEIATLTNYQNKNWLQDIWRGLYFSFPGP